MKSDDNWEGNNLKINDCDGLSEAAKFLWFSSTAYISLLRIREHEACSGEEGHGAPGHFVPHRRAIPIRYSRPLLADPGKQEQITYVTPVTPVTFKPATKCDKNDSGL